MKSRSFALRAFLVLCAFGSSLQAQQITLFQDNFESGNLNLWTGKPGVPTSGRIVPDPLNTNNHVLVFTQTAAAGDIFSASSITVTGQPQPLVLRFDFLGLAIGGQEPTEYGGFAGITTDPSGVLPHYWLGGTYFPALNVPPSIGTMLTADGHWHHYDIDFTSLVSSANLRTIQIQLEDWYDRGSIPGDIYFDNVRLTAGIGAQPPVISCPADIAQATDAGQCSAVVSFSVTTDNQPGVTIQCHPPSGSSFPVGTTSVDCTASNSVGTASCRFSVTVEDREPSLVACRKGANPSGKNIPVAGRNSPTGENPDGFFQLLASDNCGLAAQIYIKDSASEFVAGPFVSGDTVKIVTAHGGTPTQKPGPREIAAHIHLNGEALMYAVDAAGNVSSPVKCVVRAP